MEVEVTGGLGHRRGAVMRPSMASGPAGRRSWIGAPSRFLVREISEKARKMEKGEIRGGGLACWWPPAELLAGDDGRRTEGEARGSVEGARRGGAREGAEALGDRWREVDRWIGPVGKTRWSSGCGGWWDGDPERVAAGKRIGWERS